jgi:hypothetical protein
VEQGSTPNIEPTEIPPQISGNPLSITEQVGNSHELNVRAKSSVGYGRWSSARKLVA